MPRTSSLFLTHGAQKCNPLAIRARCSVGVPSVGCTCLPAVVGELWCAGPGHAHLSWWARGRDAKMVSLSAGNNKVRRNLKWHLPVSLSLKKVPTSFCLSSK